MSDVAIGVTALSMLAIVAAMAKNNAPDPKRTFATGGGNATASGVSFQASVGAHFVVSGLADSPVDARLGLGAAIPVALRFETEAPVDDVLVKLGTGGWLFAQGKNSLSSSKSISSELGKTCDEFIRLWELAVKGTGQHGWDRPLRPGVDALLIAVGPGASSTIRNDLANALDKNRSESLAATNGAEQVALDRLRKLTQDVIIARGAPASGIDVEDVLKFVFILTQDFGGPDRSAAEAWLANSLVERSAAPAAFAVLEKDCERRMSARDGTSIMGFRAVLSGAGVAVKAPPEFERDVQALRDRSVGVAETLADFEKTSVGTIDLTIARDASVAAVRAAGDGSFVLIGDPGSGKSAVINEVARQLKASGSEVVLLAMDRLPVETQEGLANELGLTHQLTRVLENWPGVGPAFLILDALDACRFARSEMLFRTIMREAVKLDGGRWRVVASIRTFDLIVGNEFKALFRGVPPDPAFVDQRFPTVRHVRVGDWSDRELADLLAGIPALGTAIKLGGQKLADLARVPFNTRLLGELLSGGAKPEEFQHLRSQAQLMDLYWNHRVTPIGNQAVQCLRNTVSAMIDRNRMEARSVDAGAGTGQALDRLQQNGVLISTSNGRDVAFRHHILFDYVASRVLIDVEDQASLKEIFRSTGTGLLLAPALTFALQHRWETAGLDRSAFWRAVCDLAGDGTIDPIARTAAARIACELPQIEADMGGLLSLIRSGAPEPAFESMRDIVEALAIRLEDEKDTVPLEPWSYLAEGLAPFVGSVAWPLRTLIVAVLDRKDRDEKS